MKNQINLNTEYVDQITEQLNVLLSNVQVFYMNVRGFHWNVTGDHFFVLHEKFEELYNSLNDKADEIAERIITMEKTPIHTFSEYLKKSVIAEKSNISSGRDTVKEVLEGLKVLLKYERELSSIAADNGDEGTVALLTGYIPGQEKMIWMFNAFLK